MSEASPWPNKKPLKAVPAETKKVGWRDDPDYLDNWYIGALSDTNLSESKSTRYDKGYLAEILNLIATRRTPYENFGEFQRDAGIKWYRQLAERLGDPKMMKAAKAMTVYIEDRDRAATRALNKELLKNQKDALDNAESDQEIKAVLELCIEARGNMQGKQLAELEGIITNCKGRLSR